MGRAEATHHPVLGHDEKTHVFYRPGPPFSMCGYETMGRAEATDHPAHGCYDEKTHVALRPRKSCCCRRRDEKERGQLEISIRVHGGIHVVAHQSRTHHRPSCYYHERGHGSGGGLGLAGVSLNGRARNYRQSRRRRWTRYRSASGGVSDRYHGDDRPSLPRRIGGTCLNGPSPPRRIGGMCLNGPSRIARLAKPRQNSCCKTRNSRRNHSVASYSLVRLARHSYHHGGDSHTRHCRRAGSYEKKPRIGPL